ncbi:unnamed protein product, partial [Choristocarpus tenellus]
AVSPGRRSVPPVESQRGRRHSISGSETPSSGGGRGTSPLPKPSVQVSSTMPHGLTVQELKELTKV